ncbi:MAG: hypothetical protein ACO4CZ_11365, partial [Planctomycetota bacterium]
LDVDVDPQNRAQIHVVNLEHAKAEEVAQVLSELSQAGSNPASRRGAAAWDDAAAGLRLAEEATHRAADGTRERGGVADIRGTVGR